MLKLKVRKLWGLVLTCVKVTGEKLVAGLFCPCPSLTVKIHLYKWSFKNPK